VVFKLGFQKVCEVGDGFDFRLLNVFHAAVNVFVGFFIFCLLGAEVFFDAEVFLFGFLHLAKGGVVGEAAGFEFLAGRLGRLEVGIALRGYVPGILSFGRGISRGILAILMLHLSNMRLVVLRWIRWLVRVL
jgi:hypothetical protein